MMQRDELHGPRVALIPMHERHAADLHEAVRHSLAALRRFPATMLWALDEPCEQRSQEFCRIAADGWNTGQQYVFALHDRERARLAGSVGLHRVNRAVPCYELGFWIDSRSEGRGLVGEAGRLILEFAGERVRARRVQAIVDQENLRARRVCERLGFRLEGVKTNAARDPVSNGLRHLALYAKVWPDAA